MNLLHATLHPRLHPALALAGAAAPAAFRVDIEETADAYRLRADMPGVTKEQVSIDVEDDALTITANYGDDKPGVDAGGDASGDADGGAPDANSANAANRLLRRERYSGKVARRFTLSPDILAERISATLENGVLTVVLPKGENTRNRKIVVS